MGPRGRAGFWGGPRGGSRGRGPFRGRGGARGGRGGRGGRASQSQTSLRFGTARLEQKDESGGESDQAASEVEDQDTEDSDVAGSEDEDESKAPSRPYMTLIKSLAHDSGAPHAKRRKLSHQGVQQNETPNAEPTLAGEDEAKDVDLVLESDEAADDSAAENFSGDDDDAADDADDPDDEAMDSSDPFESHFSSVAENANLLRKLEAIDQGKWSTNKSSSRGLRTVFSAPDTSGERDLSPPAPTQSPSELHLKQKLKEKVAAKHAQFSGVEKSLAPFIFGYRDLIFCNRMLSNGKDLRRLACLHALNHVFKTRDRVIKDNARLARDQENEDLELRDQGFTRPKVLMILPTRESCFDMIETMCTIYESDIQENRKRFEDSYHSTEDRFSGDKPADFRDLFHGNDDDMFRIGIKFTRKTIKFFSQFYNSDILLASPLGLRMAIGSEDGQKIEHDFLSSIEVVVVDQADALLMQNWEHVEFIFDHLNLQPKDDHGCDFSRVRNWYLENQARYFRQTLAFSSYHTPELLKLFRLHCRNWAGRARIEPQHPGVINEIGVKARQTFSRFLSASIEDDPEARFAYFTKAVVPTLVKRSRDSVGTLIFIPSYLDFVRVRNYFATNTAVESLTFGTISEYASIPEASRARSHFFAGRHKVLLYTERAHHFRRYQLKGVQRVVMYGLPDNPLFYKEISGGNLAKAEQDLKLEPGQGSVRVIFSKYDVLKLERIVGTQRVGKMIRERGDTFDFI